MKASRLIFTGMMLFFAGTMQAQFSMSVNFGTPPPWGPVGYTAVRYYYLPDVEAYYDIQASMFVYFSGSAWVHRTYLPPRYKGYDLYRGYKVVMQDYHGNAPYIHFKEHKMKYAKGYHGKPQKTYHEGPGKGNSGSYKPHGSPNGNQGGDHGKGNSSGHGNDKGNSHGNDKNKNDNHGHDNGNGKKK